MRESIRLLPWALPLLAVLGCDQGHADLARTPALVQVAVVTPKTGDVVRSLTLPGDLVGFYEAALHAKVSGYLKRIAVDKGDVVHAGQVLAEIEVPELEQKVKRARANMEIRRLTRERLEHVWSTDKRLIAREDVDIAESELEQARAEVEELEALMSYTHIVAPFGGVITGRFVDPGALIQATGSQAKSSREGSAPVKGENVPVLSLADISELRVYVYVPENETSAIRVDMPAELTLKEFPGRVFAGTVARFTKSLDLSTRTMLTEVELANPDGELYPGMYADVRLDLARHPAALQVPSTAIGRAAAGPYVYVVRENHLQRLPLTLGIGTEGWVEATSGVSSSDAVVRNLSPVLKEGEEVEPLTAGADASPARLGS